MCQYRKLNGTYTRLFKEIPPEDLKRPLDMNDYPELDTSDLLKGE